jgi:hypothetical protein
MMRPRQHDTHEERRPWSNLALLVPVAVGSNDGYYWRFDWEPVLQERKYVGKRWKLVPQPVKEMVLIPQAEPVGAASLPPLWRKHYRHFVELAKVLGGDQKAIEEFVPPSTDPDYRKTVSKNPHALLSARFCEAVSHVKFVMWQKKDGRKLLPGLLLASEEMVPFALAAYNSIYERGQRFCERKSCGKEFVSTDKRDQRFCSYLCRKAVQEQRRRDKKRQTRSDTGLHRSHQ